MDLAVIYENIQRLLKAKKLSRNALSKRSGANDAIRNIERKLDGRIKGKGITAATLSKIATELGVSPDYLTKRHRQTSVEESSGVRQALLEKIEYLTQERDRAVLELEAFDAEREAAEKGPKRKNR